MSTAWHIKAKARLKELGRTQAWLAGEVKASPPAVSLWFKGTHNPNLGKIKRIAEILDMSFAELVEDDDAICQDLHELMTLRNLRTLPEDKRQQIMEFIANYTKGANAEGTQGLQVLPPPHLDKQNK